MSANWFCVVGLHFYPFHKAIGGVAIPAALSKPMLFVMKFNRIVYTGKSKIRINDLILTKISLLVNLPAGCNKDIYLQKWLTKVKLFQFTHNVYIALGLWIMFHCKSPTDLVPSSWYSFLDKKTYTDGSLSYSFHPS